MSFSDVTLKGGPLDGGRVPIHGSTPHYGLCLEVPYIEERIVGESMAAYFANARAKWTDRCEVIAIYKCLGDKTAQFVGVLR